jgi:hypothetical protein
VPWFGASQDKRRKPRTARYESIDRVPLKCTDRCALCVPPDQLNAQGIYRNHHPSHTVLVVAVVAMLHDALYSTEHTFLAPCTVLLNQRSELFGVHRIVQLAQ